jgi:hypothetical protein
MTGIGRWSGRQEDQLTQLDETPIETVRSIHVIPDAGVLRAIGLNHGFDSAIADLVDNSIDAQARNVLVRFVLRDGLATGLLVVDDGAGMDEAGIDDAMRLGRRKHDSAQSLGHFGMGLKSASFSQASTLTVLSRRIRGEYEGRRMRRENPTADFEVDVLDPEAVGRRMQSMSSVLGSATTGTVVQWDHCRTFPASQDRAVTTRFLEAKIAELRNRLGLVFHRLLERDAVTITVDVWDSDEQESGLAYLIEPIDPFDYPRTGLAGYPKTLVARHKDHDVHLRCHIWPGGSDSPQFRLHGRPVEGFQGFYLYRNDRLLMTGGWGGVTNESKAFKLARVGVEIEDHLDGFTMSMEKSGVQLVADLVHAIEESAAADGTTFRAYLDEASEAFKASNRRVRRRPPILPPGQGLHPRVKRAIEREAPVLEGEEPVRIKWTKFTTDDFVEVDRHNRTLWLNSRYRAAVLHGDTAGLNDAPLLKTLLFLVFEDLFQGQVLGAKDKENQYFWNEVLTSAAQAEQAEWHR